LDTITRVREHLSGLGWPKPVVADSGNGYHLLYRIDLPTDDGGLVKRVLASLAHRFDTVAVKIDQQVFNPSRIVKLYGTMARKGDNLADRPHRWTEVLALPDQLVVVETRLLEELAAEAPPDKAVPTVSRRSPGRDRIDLARIQERARAYLKKMPPAVA